MSKKKICLPVGRHSIDVDYPSIDRREKAKRRARWDAGERPICKNHSACFVQKSGWISSGKRLCHACANTRHVSPSALRRRANIAKAKPKETIRVLRFN